MSRFIPRHSVTAGATSAERWLVRNSGRGPDCAAEPGDDIDRVTRAWNGFLNAVRRELHRRQKAPVGTFPHYTEGGHWKLLDSQGRSGKAGSYYDHGNWTAGFSPGLLWLYAAGSGDGDAIKLARSDLAQIAPRADDHTTHDLGFLFHPSIVLGRLVGEVAADQEAPAVRAARMLAFRFNTRTDLIQAFGPIGEPSLAGTSTIDTMMNLPLLWWAAGHGGDVLMLDAARRHARTSARLYFRPDGSTYHLLTLDPISGALLARGTFQGADSESCWSRGQAWAVCGFAWAFGVTGEHEFLCAAERAAAYFFDHLPEDAVPPWDFNSHDAHSIRDASASAVVALGCVLLASTHPSPADRNVYRRAAHVLLGSLADSCLDASGLEDGILQHSCYSKPHAMGVDSATAWGDYYFGLALACATGILAVRTLLGGDLGWPFSSYDYDADSNRTEEVQMELL